MHDGEPRSTNSLRFEIVSAHHFEQAEQRRTRLLDEDRRQFDAKCEAREAEVAQANERLDTLISNLAYGVDEAVHEYVTIVLSSSVYPDAFPVDHEFEYNDDVKELVLTSLVPPPNAPPKVKEYTYAHPDGWRVQIRWATLDLSASYKMVFDTMLPDATQVADGTEKQSRRRREGKTDALDSVRIARETQADAAMPAAFRGSPVIPAPTSRTAGSGSDQRRHGGAEIWRAHRRVV